MFLCTVSVRLRILAVLLVLPYAAYAQGYQLEGSVFERGHTPPSFEAPIVEIAVVDDLSLVNSGGGDLGDFSRRITTELEGNEYVFSNFLGDMTLTNRKVVFSAQSGEWILPGLQYVQLDAGLAGNRPIEVTLGLQRRSVLAEAYRKEVFDIYRQDNLTEEDYLRAVTAAQRAVEDDPKLDNYLLAIRGSRVALFQGGVEHPTLITSLGDLQAMPGFAALTFAARWRVQSDLLDMLASAPDPEAPAFFGENYREATIAAATQMIGQLDVDTPDLANVPATRVFNTLIQMHAANGDCPSLIRTASRATVLAEPLNMNWASQRGFLLDWGDCLEQLSGVGNGRSEETFLAETRGNATLQRFWAAYATALTPNELNFLFPATPTDERLKALAERSRAISEGT